MALDLFPVLRRLPDFLVPVRAWAKELHRKEKQLYMGHWMDVKKRILNGTAKVRMHFHGWRVPTSTNRSISPASALTW